MNVRRARLLVLFPLAVGCSTAPLLVPDAAHYTPRDAVVAPRPDAEVDASLLDDIGPQVDVTPFDGPVRLDAAYDSAIDVPLSCHDLANLYVENIQMAQACTMAADCDTLACETPCCACQVFVQAGTAPYLRLDSLRTQWTVMGCAAMAACPTSTCTAPVAPACGTLARCVTVRTVGDGGL